MIRTLLFVTTLLVGLIWTADASAQFSGQIIVNRPVGGNTAIAYPYGNFGVPSYSGNYGYGGYRYSAPYRSRAYPYGTSYLGPTIYPGRNYYRQYRVYRTPARSNSFNRAHSSHYFGNPHASQYFGN